MTLTPEDLQNQREWRETLWKIVLLLTTVFAAYMGIENRTLLVESDQDRVRLEEKIDEAKVTTEAAAEKAEAAVEKAEIAVEEVRGWQ